MYVCWVCEVLSHPKVGILAFRPNMRTMHHSRFKPESIPEILNLPKERFEALGMLRFVFDSFRRSMRRMRWIEIPENVCVRRLSESEDARIIEESIYSCCNGNVFSSAQSTIHRRPHYDSPPTFTADIHEYLALQLLVSSLEDYSWHLELPFMQQSNVSLTTVSLPRLLIQSVCMVLYIHTSMRRDFDSEVLNLVGHLSHRQ